MKIGIFGGCFNPPHNMHKNIGLSLVKNGYLERVIYVPTGEFYRKNDLVSFKYRLEMLKLIISDIDNLSVSDIGNNRHFEYTYQLLDYFQKLYNHDEIYFICGSDNLNEFSSWKNYEYILSYYKLLVIKRNNDDIDEITNKFRKFIDNIIWANIDFGDISSTELRKLINNQNYSLLQNKLDDIVIKYIMDNKLYESNDMVKEGKSYEKCC